MIAPNNGTDRDSEKARQRARLFIAGHAGRYT